MLLDQTRLMETVLRCNYSAVITSQSIHPFYKGNIFAAADCVTPLNCSIVYQNAQNQKLSMSIQT